MSHSPETPYEGFMLVSVFFLLKIKGGVRFIKSLEKKSHSPEEKPNVETFGLSSTFGRMQNPTFSCFSDLVIGPENVR